MTIRNQATGLAPAMSRKHRQDRNDPRPPPTEPSAFNETDEDKASPRDVAKHLRCPSCYSGLGGVAARRKWWRQISGPLHQRCYACGECGTEWVVEVRSEVVDDIEHKTTKVTEVRKAE